MKTDTCPLNASQERDKGAPSEQVHEYMKRVCNHCEEDRRSFLRLVNYLLLECAPNSEEAEQTLRSMDEIAGDPPGTAGPAQVMTLELPSPASLDAAGDDVKPRSDPLRKWVEFLASKIRNAREKAGLTQAQLAEKAGLPQSHISRIENGVHSPSYKTIGKIATALGMKHEELDPR